MEENKTRLVLADNRLSEVNMILKDLCYNDDYYKYYLFGQYWCDFERTSHDYGLQNYISIDEATNEIKALFNISYKREFCWCELGFVKFDKNFKGFRNDLTKMIFKLISREDINKIKIKTVSENIDCQKLIHDYIMKKFYCIYSCTLKNEVRLLDGGLRNVESFEIHNVFPETEEELKRGVV